MKLILTRQECSENGVFSILSDENGTPLFFTAEHAYDAKPKITDGVHKCVRGQHNLHSGPIETFEITGISGHYGLLFHAGNYPQKDSNGCVLVGRARVGDMVVNSKKSFADFLNILLGIDEFELEVK